MYSDTVMLYSTTPPVGGVTIADERMVLSLRALFNFGVEVVAGGLGGRLTCRDLRPVHPFGGHRIETARTFQAEINRCRTHS